MKKKELQRQLFQSQAVIASLYKAIDGVLDAEIDVDDRQLQDALLELRRQRGTRISAFIETWSLPE